MKFDNVMRAEGTLVIVERITWNASASKSRTTFRLSEDSGKTFKAIPFREAMFLLGKL